MKYAVQLQTALDRLDNSLAQLHTLVKRGENAAAIRYMETGQLKERFEEMQNIITISQTNNLGASGVQNVGNL